MKHLIKYGPYFYFVLFFGYFHIGANAQVFLNKNYLSDDVRGLVNSNPEQALKIAQYLLSKTNTTTNEKAKINFLVSRAYQVKGDYSSALNFLYEESNYKEYLSDEDNINIAIRKIILLRELSLDKEAKKILKKLEKSIDDISEEKSKRYLELSIAVENAQFFLKDKKIQEGINLLNSKKSFAKNVLKDYKEFEIYYHLAFGQLFLAQENLSQARKYFDISLDLINNQSDDNAYYRTEALYGLANVLFREKKHDEVISLCEEAMVYANQFNNHFLQMKILQLKNLSYLALKDMANYKLTNTKFFEFQDVAENQEQEAINTTYNLISDEFYKEFSDSKSGYVTTLYYVLSLFLITLLICLFFWQKIMQRKQKMDEIISYIEITRSNLLGGFSISDKRAEPKKNVILKETEEQILIKLKKFESSKRFINNDISLAVLSGQLDSNTKYLSEIINTHYNVNFNTYINKLRINYIIGKLKTDPNFINYKISYLAENCGFSSHSSFATVFKTITGISPVKFIELLNQEKENNLLE